MLPLNDSLKIQSSDRLLDTTGTNRGQTNLPLPIDSTKITNHKTNYRALGNHKSSHFKCVVVSIGYQMISNAINLG